MFCLTCCFWCLMLESVLISQIINVWFLSIEQSFQIHNKLVTSPLGIGQLHWLFWRKRTEDFPLDWTAVCNLCNTLCKKLVPSFFTLNTAKTNPMSLIFKLYSRLCGLKQRYKDKKWLNYVLITCEVRLLSYFSLLWSYLIFLLKNTK